MEGEREIESPHPGRKAGLNKFNLSAPEQMKTQTAATEKNR
jgi:hypothetical protein